MVVDVWRAVRWWDDWQLRILVLGSLGLQWFLLLAAPMRKYSIPRIIRTFIWLAYISSDALAIYALATLFNRHARATHTITCSGDVVDAAGRSKHSSSILEILWAPILLIHLGGQEELTAYEIEDNEMWTRHTVTLVSQVAVALYAFYKSWPPSSDWRLLSAAVLLFVIGVTSFSEKPLALNRAKIKRLASISALIQGTDKRSKWRVRLRQFFLFEESNCFTNTGLQTTATGVELLPSCCGGNSNNRQDDGGSEVALLEGDKVLMVLSDMSLLAAANDLVDRGRAHEVKDVLPPLDVAEEALPRWLRGAFAFIYTRANVVVTVPYLGYHLLVAPALHIAAITLFAVSDKHPYKRPDVKITYILLCLTAALDIFAVFIRQLLYRLMSKTQVPALCETMPGYNVIDAAVLESDKHFGFIYKCGRQVGMNCKDYFALKPELGKLYRKVSTTVLADLVDARDRDLATYRVFSRAHNSKPEDKAEMATTSAVEHIYSNSNSNWVLDDDLQEHCGKEIRKSLDSVSFDRSVLLWHIATDLCFRCMDTEDQQHPGGGGGGGGGGRGARPLAKKGQMRLSGDDGGNDGKAKEEKATRVKRSPLLKLHMECAHAIANYMAHLLNFNPDMLLTGSREHMISEAMKEVNYFFSSHKIKLDGAAGREELKTLISNIADDTEVPIIKVKSEGKATHASGALHVFHLIEACKLAKELLNVKPDNVRWRLMYKVWLGMLCYSASMCRGYLHAKSLGEGGEFLSFVWLVLSLKGAKTLADKLQMPGMGMGMEHQLVSVDHL